MSISHCPGECRNTHSAGARRRRRRYADGGNKIAVLGTVPEKKGSRHSDKHLRIVPVNVRNYFRRVGAGEDE